MRLRPPRPLAGAALFLAALVLPPHALRAQAAPPAAAVLRGTVTDSLGGYGPVPNATVALHGAGRETFTDLDGRFALTDVPPGEYVMLVSHMLLDSTGVGTLQIPLRLRAGDTTDVQVATPTPASMLLAFCSQAADGGDAMFHGRVADAATGAPVADALVRATWVEWEFGREGLQRIPMWREARTDAAGAYALCQVPAGHVVDVQATAADRRSGVVQVAADVRGVGYRPLLVAASPPADDAAPGAPVGGAPLAATVRGTVHTADGGRAGGAIVSLAGSTREAVADSAGRFRLSGVPAGTQTLQVRAIGREPGRTIVDLRAGADTAVALAVGPAVQELEAVTVYGRPDGRTRTALAAAERVRASGSGTLLDAQRLARIGAALNVDDLLRGTRGVRIAYDGTGRVFATGSAGGGACPLAWVIDGVGMEPGAPARNLVRPNEVLTIEVYPRIATAPPEYAVLVRGACALAVVWTNR